MALGIYKSGQGYWVRVLTATMLGIVTLSAAAWLWNQMGVLATKLPKTQYSMSVADVDGTAPKAGDRVTLLARAETAGTDMKELATATVMRFNSRGTGGVLTIDGVARPANLAAGVADPDPLLATRVTGPGFSAVASQVSGQSSIQPVTLQGSVVALVILIGFVIAYYLTAMHQRFVEFLIATDMEMKKVNWSTPKEIRKSTLVVIFAAFLLAGSLFMVDMTFQWFFRAIGVLVY